MADHKVSSFQYIVTHTVVFELKSSSSPLSIVAIVDLDEPSKSDDRPMVSREGSKHRKCGTSCRPITPQQAPITGGTARAFKRQKG